MTETHKIFKMDLEALPLDLRLYAVSGSVFFYLGFSHFLHGRKVHIQLEDGEQPCKCKKSSLCDGSIDRIMYDGKAFKWVIRSHGYERTYYVQEIPNPITCKKCNEWLLKHYR